MDSVLKSFSKFVTMNIFSMLALAFCLFVDAYMVSIVRGAHGLAVLSITSPMYTLIGGTGIMLGVGAGSSFGRLKAYGKKEAANKSFSTAVYLAMFLTVLFVLIGVFFSQQIARFFGATDYLIYDTTLYLQTILILAPGLLLANALGGIIRNDGAPRVVLFGSVVFSLTNILFDYLFLFTIDMGLFGAALATSLASMLNLAILLFYWWKGPASFKFLKSGLCLENLKEILVLGAPPFIGELAWAMIMTVFNLVLLNMKGSIGVAAFGIIANLSFLVLCLFSGLGQGLQPLACTYFGKGDYQNLKKVFRYAILTAIGLSALVYKVFFVFTDFFVTLFNSDGNAQLANLTSRGLVLYFSGFIFVGINIVIINFFSVTTAPKLSVFLSFLRGGVFIVPLIILAANYMNVTGVWLAYPISELLTFGCVVLSWKMLKQEKGQQLKSI
jgi:putative MATE family efflux protein